MPWEAPSFRRIEHVYLLLKFLQFGPVNVQNWRSELKRDFKKKISNLYFKINLWDLVDKKKHLTEQENLYIYWRLFKKFPHWDKTEHLEANLI